MKTQEHVPEKIYPPRVFSSGTMVSIERTFCFANNQKRFNEWINIEILGIPLPPPITFKNIHSFFISRLKALKSPLYNKSQTCVMILKMIYTFVKEGWYGYISFCVVIMSAWIFIQERGDKQKGCAQISRINQTTFLSYHIYVYINKCSDRSIVV